MNQTLEAVFYLKQLWFYDQKINVWKQERKPHLNEKESHPLNINDLWYIFSIAAFKILSAVKIFFEW